MKNDNDVEPLSENHFADTQSPILPADPEDVTSGLFLQRRNFLKNMCLATAGAIAGPAVLQTGGAVSQAHAAPGSGNSSGKSSSADATTTSAPLQTPAGHIPVLAFNDAHESHLLSIDLRSKANLLALNDTYGNGTYIPTGSLEFNSHRGLQAQNATSGLMIDLDRILSGDVRLALAEQGQFTIELERNRIADPWLISEYTDRYSIIRDDPGNTPASKGDFPFSELTRLCCLVSDDDISGPVIDGPSPEMGESNANNLCVKLHARSYQSMNVGIHSAVHGEFCAVTVAWWSRGQFTVYVDSTPYFIAGPSVVGPYGVEVRQDSYVTNDVTPSSVARKLIKLFFGRSGVYIRRITLGARAPVFETHPLFRDWASYGDSFTHRGGYANSKFAKADLWDTSHIFYFINRLAGYGYRPGWCENNSRGGGGYLKSAGRSLWDNGGKWDLTSLMSLSPSFVMMAASHNDAAYIGKGGVPESAEYQLRLATVKADLLEHVQVILTGSSPNWLTVLPAGDARIGIISAPLSPRAPGWGDRQAQAQRDLNQFVVNEVPEWVRDNLGVEYYKRIATFDVSKLFGPEHLVDYHPLFQRSGTGVHPSWWGGNLLNYGWWQCALRLIENENSV